MSNLCKIHRKDGSYLVDDIRLDHAETIKVVGEDGIVIGLPFSVPDNEAQINDQ